VAPAVQVRGSEIDILPQRCLFIHEMLDVTLRRFFRPKTGIQACPFNPPQCQKLSPID
jgi:hypothetical protein